MPIKKIEIANALITCIILISILVGRFGSFFLKKYISQMYKIKRHSDKDSAECQKILYTKKRPR